LRPSTKLYLKIASERKGQDVTFIMNTTEMMDFVAFINRHDYEEFNISHVGNYHFVSVMSNGFTAFFVEDIYTEDEEIIKYNETDVLVLPTYLPTEIESELLKGDFNELIRIGI
jgi:hypothetical protein